MVVKVETTEPGLYGLGCATFTQRALAVKTAVDEYLAPLLAGRDPRRSEDVWQSAFSSSYWRSGPVLNNALSGVDMALWDIKGKLAGLPLYELLGGKMPRGGGSLPARRRKGRERGRRQRPAVRRPGVPARPLPDGRLRRQSGPAPAPEGALDGAYFDPAAYARSVPRMFETVRKRVGPDIELLHDVHERLVPGEAVRLAKELEPFRLFFLEDLLPPEHVEWFRLARAQSTVPLAMGELFTNPAEWMPLVSGRLIDFIRVHLSAIGGITPAIKLAHLADAFGVRTAWHGPGDVSPVGHAANVHLDVAVPNFGIQEWSGFDDRLREVFPGLPEERARVRVPERPARARRRPRREGGGALPARRRPSLLDHDANPRRDRGPPVAEAAGPCML